MKLTILGSGTFMPTKEQNPSCILLEIDGKRLLLDAGHGALRRLVDSGIDPQSIDIVFVSHFHADHFSDVFPMVQARFVADLYRGIKEHRPLEIWGPPTLKERYQKWREIFWPEPQETSSHLRFREGSFKIMHGKVKIETFRVHHVPWFQSVGIRIDYQGKRVVYTADIGSDHPFKDLVKQTKGADLLIIESGYKMRTPNHYTLEQTKEVMAAAKIKRVLLVHTRPDHRAYFKQALRGSKNILLAEDGMKLSI